MSRQATSMARAVRDLDLPLPVHMRNSLSMILIKGGVASLAALLVAMLVLKAWPSLFGRDWNKTFASLTDGGCVRALVHGYTDSPLAAWYTSLLWKKEEDKWFVYHLNHDAYFQDYKLSQRGLYIDVFCNGRLLATLNTSNNELFHAGQNILYKKPIDIIHDANLDDRERWTYWINRE